MLAGKVILVTGAASGIGAAAARVFAGYGARLVLTDRDGGGVAAVAAALDGAIGIAADITSEADMRAAVGLAVAQCGGLDGAFNNAGVEQAGAAMIRALTIRSPISTGCSPSTCAACWSACAPRSRRWGAAVPS